MASILYKQLSYKDFVQVSNSLQPGTEPVSL